MQSQALMARYRELGSNLETAVQVRVEFQEKGQQHWHRLYERCWCGFLTVPAQCYEYDDKGRQTNTQEQAEKVYLASCDEIPVTKSVRDETHVTKGRPKKHASHAERQAAYRERSMRNERQNHHPKE
ncbi:hypothetical protein LCGC14_2648430 [marine sediment metagenome]|uniref:Uncharacterized protein n=1 Tax=marine sediment metagenome TaxID=412755 RepID=A0A0F9C613_9ZZZZ